MPSTEAGAGRDGVDEYHSDDSVLSHPDEGRQVLAEMAENGLNQGNGLEVYMMCEVPSNVILADEFCQIFDGFSIGSNDLTQLTLGLDSRSERLRQRDSVLVSHIFDERHPAVMAMVKRAFMRD